jgi:hypothetical protein
MIRILLYFLVPGEKLPEGSAQISLGSEGISWGWALALFVILTAAVIASYQRYAATVPVAKRAGLVFLRCILIALLLLLLVRPVIQIAPESKVRRPLLVLVDQTQSMGLVDHRNTAEDLARVAIARGLVDPTAGLQHASGAPDPSGDISRHDLLEALAANSRLALWPQLQKKADLLFYGVGRQVTDLGELRPPPGSDLTTAQSAAFFHSVADDENRTALGDSLRAILDQERGQPIAGILLITDGGNNSGSPPMEAAEMAREDGVPLYIYGVGITSPQDIIVTGLKAPPVCNVHETVVVTAHLRVQNLIGRKATLQLMANGRQVDEQTIEIRADGDQEFNLSFTPDLMGETDLKVDVPPLPEEAVKDNNSASTKIRVVDTKLNVLVIQGQPNWDFQFLVTTLQRDRRVKVKCFLVNGDEGLSEDPNSPFLDRLPDDKAGLYANDVIILGDVDPAVLGEGRMNLLNDWVSKNGGGLIFLAGPQFDPAAYDQTPLKSLLPVEPGSSDPVESYTDPVPLKLTLAGESSPLLNLAPNAQDNRTIWEAFPGVSWTASAGRAKPGAQVLLTDPTPSRATPAGPMPVMAQQTYGLGRTLYIGFDETYRWRSHLGEKYYTRLWGQILQALGDQRTAPPSVLTELKTDRSRYFTGDRVILSGRFFKPGYVAVDDPEVAGTLVLKPDAPPGHAAPAPVSSDVHLQPVPDNPGAYTTQFIARAAGSYSFSVARDPAVTAKFDVVDPKIELADTAMNAPLLQAMATASGGAFFREETLYQLPSRITSEVLKSSVLKNVPLAFSPVLLAIMILAGCLEWFWRRRLELK